jgi:predicted nucleotidyltransferase
MPVPPIPLLRGTLITFRRKCGKAGCHCAGKKGTPHESPALSDVDLLVTFESGKTPGLAFIDLAEDLETLFGCHVDLLTRDGVESDFNPHRRRSILATVEPLYAA